MFRIESQARLLKLKKLSFEIDFTNNEKENFLKFIRSQTFLGEILIQSFSDEKLLHEVTNAVKSCKALTIKKL